MKNIGIIGRIKENIEIKRLEIKIIKVKAHSGDSLNERADILAKEERRDMEITKLSKEGSVLRVFQPL